MRFVPGRRMRRQAVCSLASASLAWASAHAAPPGVTVESSTPSAIVVRLAFPAPSVSDVTVRGETYADVRIPEIEAMDAAGWPRLPVYVASLGLPPDRTVASVRLEPIATEHRDTPPVRQVDANSPEATAASYASPPYAQGSPSLPYPREGATLLDVGWWRNRRIAHVAVHPVRTVPGQRGIDAATEVRLVVTLAPERVASTKVLPARFGDDPWDAAIDEQLLNGAESRGWLRSESPRAGRRGTADYFSGSTKWVRIETEGEGLTRVTGAQLATTGAPFPIADASSIRLFVGRSRELPETPPVFDPDVPDWMREVAILVEDGGDGRLDANAGDRVEFFAVPTDGYLADIDPAAAGSDTTLQYTYYTNHYASRRSYWLTWDGTFTGTPARMGVASAAPLGTPDSVFSEVPRRIHAERDAWYDPNPSSGESPSPITWEKWWWNLGFSRGDGGATIVRFDLPGHVPGSAGSFVARFWGVTQADGSLPDHIVVLTCNGNTVPPIEWNGRTRYDATVLWPEGQTHLIAGSNRFTVAIDTRDDPDCHSPCVRQDKVYLAWIDVRDRYALAWGGQDIDFRSVPLAGHVRYRVTGLPDGALDVLDVTDPVHPIRLVDGAIAGGAGTTSLEFDRTEDPSVKRRYVVTHTSVRKAAAAMTRHTPPGTAYLRERSSPIDYVIIYEGAFAAAAQSLRDLRSSYVPGIAAPAVLAVPVQAVFDEFSFGVRDPTAIRDFLKYAYENYRDAGAPTTPRLRYATLIGDASFDHRQRMLAATEDFVPAWSNRYDYSLWSQGYVANWPADDYLVLFDGRQTANLYLAVGRLPAQTPGQALEIVQKVRDHTLASDRGAWRSRIAMVADDICQGECYDDPFFFTHTYQAENELIPAIPEDMDFRRVYLTEFPDPVTGIECHLADKPAARDALLDAINDGVWLVDYVGHGGATQMADEKVLLSSDIPAMQNAGRYHYFMTASCSVGKFDEVTEGLAETILKSAGGGSVLSVSASAVASSGDNVELNAAILRSLFASGSTRADSLRSFGEAFVIARALRGFRLNDTKYNVLGDPATILAWGDDDATLSLAVAGSPPFAVADTLWRGETMTVSGQMIARDGTPDASYDGTADLEVFDSEEIRHRDTYTGHDCDGASVAIFPRDYRLPGAPIYRASVPVQDGQFETSFVVPLGLRRGNRGDARIRCMARGAGSGPDGLGTIEHITVPDDPRPGWSSNDADGPSITLSFAGPPLAVPLRSNLRVEFDDPSGINITQLLDSRSVVLSFEETNGFVAALVDLAPDLRFGADFTTASIDVPIPTSLSAGRSYTVRVAASDNLGNRGQASTDIFLVGTSTPELQRVFAYPNPSDGESVGLFVDVNVAVRVSARIYTVSGRLLRTLEASLAPGEGRSRPVVWDLRDEDADRVANGSYLYVIDVEPAEGGKERREGWIAVLR